MHCTHLNQVKEAFTEIQQVFIGLQKHSFSNYKSFYKHSLSSALIQIFMKKLQCNYNFYKKKTLHCTHLN